MASLRRTSNDWTAVGQSGAATRDDALKNSLFRDREARQQVMQLVAYGAQDIYLTGNPQITFFKVVYRRHTNFSVESIEQTFM